MKTKITLTRLYKKEVVIEVFDDRLSGMTPEEIADVLCDAYEIENEEELFNKAELEMISFPEEILGIDADTDRYDIYDENGEHVYGGHL